MAPSSALPIGASRAVSEMQPVVVDPSIPGSGLLHAILAILSAHPSDLSDEDLVDVDIAGFILVYVSDFLALGCSL